MYGRLLCAVLVVGLHLIAVVPARQVFAAGVVGNGTPASCSEGALDAALRDGGSITFRCGDTPHTITITQSKRIERDTSIDGGGRLTLRGGNAREIITVAPGATLTLANLVIRDTSATRYDVGSTLYNSGGMLNLSNVHMLNNNRKALFNQGGTTTVVASRFQGNTTSGSGSAITNESGGSVTIRRSVFLDNSVRDIQTGGAIYNGDDSGNEKTTITIMSSTFERNTAGEGAAVRNFGTMTVANSLFTRNGDAASSGTITTNSDASLAIENSTLSLNTANRGGGIVATGPQPGNAATLTNVTLAYNTAPEGSNLLLLGGASMTLRNTLVVNTTAASANCLDSGTGSSAFVDGGTNIQFPGTSCGARMESVDPRLGALGDNGGLTSTHALPADSPARNTANNTRCPRFDQRGVVRPQDGTCDVGAVEHTAVPVVQAISPIMARANGPALTLVVTGANFIDGPKGSVVVVNGTALATRWASPTELRAVVPAGFIPAGSTGSVPVVVQTPVVDGGTSATLQLLIAKTVFLPLVNT